MLEAEFSHAVQLHQQGRLVDAERIYRKVLQRDPKNAVALHLLGVVALQTGRAGRAVDLIGKAIALRPDYAEAYGNRGLALQELARSTEALASYDKAIALNPQHAEAYNNRGLVLQALRRPAEATASYDAAIALMSDYAVAHSNRGNALQELERLDEAVASFDRSIALAPDYAAAYYNRGNALRALRRHADAVASYDKAIALRPDYAEAHCNRGIALQEQGLFAAAVASYDKAIALRAYVAEAYNNRGTALQALNRPEDALASYDEAVALRPRYAEAWNSRGTVLQLLKRPEAAVASYDRAIALQADHVDAHCNRGTALQDLGHSEAALASYDTAITLRPDYAEAYTNKGLCLLRMGQLDAGWQLYEWRTRRHDYVAGRSFPQPAWRGEQDIAGKTLFIHWEQGLGDTLHFCRYAKLAEERGARVTMEVQAPLLHLMTQLSPTIRIIDPDRVAPDFDYHCPLLSLPLAFGTTLATIPSQPRHFSVEQPLRERWAARLQAPTKPRIGVAWSGGTLYKNDYSRSIDLATCLPMYSRGVEWVCIQKEIRPHDLAVLREAGGISFHGDDLHDFTDTAALLDLMDMVITVDTSVAHLAAGMGKPVWMLLPYNSEWRWLLDRSDSPWYPSVRLFRQQRAGDWSDVIDQVKRALRSVTD
jgi:tetratricopeptide (TPR) repeat protein